MKKYVDLHIHSLCSDGSYTPAQIIKRAKSYELSAIAITDHDTVACVAEGEKLAHEAGIEFIRGIEISTSSCNGRMHILGYFVDIESKKLGELIKRMQLARVERIKKICAKLTELEKPVDPELVLSMAKDVDSIGRPHIALAMIKLGHVSSVHEAFERYLGIGKPAYVPRWAPTPREAIDTIHQAHGLAVIAHCGVTQGCMESIDEIINEGIDGIEAFYPFHNEITTKKLIEIARKHDLAITGGSDCHGTVRGEPLLGVFKVPYWVYEDLVKRHQLAKAKT